MKKIDFSKFQNPCNPLKICLLTICRLGAVHDGSPPPSYLGGPGAEKCKWKDGYIMSDLRHTERGFTWSDCSVSSFHHFLKYVQHFYCLIILEKICNQETVSQTKSVLQDKN